MSQTSVTKPKNRMTQAWESVKETTLGADRFPAPIQMNFNKRTEIPTCYGLFVTFLLYMVLTVFAYQRGMMLYHRKDPTINVETIYNAFTP